MLLNVLTFTIMLLKILKWIQNGFFNPYNYITTKDMIHRNV